MYQYVPSLYIDNVNTEMIVKEHIQTTHYLMFWKVSTYCLYVWSSISVWIGQVSQESRLELNSGHLHLLRIELHILSTT